MSAKRLKARRSRDLSVVSVGGACAEALAQGNSMSRTNRSLPQTGARARIDRTNLLLQHIYTTLTPFSHCPRRRRRNTPPPRTGRGEPHGRHGRGGLTSGAHPLRKITQTVPIEAFRGISYRRGGEVGGRCLLGAVPPGRRLRTGQADERRVRGWVRRCPTAAGCQRMPLPVERREPGRMSSWFTSFSGASGASRGTETEMARRWACSSAPLPFQGRCRFDSQGTNSGFGSQAAVPGSPG